MRMFDRLNPGPGIVDFWTEFKRPNPYRWPILGGSALLTGSLLFLLTDRAVNLNWAVAVVLVLIAAIAIGALIAEHVRIRVSVLAVAAALTAITFHQFTKERVRIPPPPPEVTYITTFAPNRTEAEIKASNLANQREQDELKAEQAKREEEAKDAYRVLGRATGIDVDKLERQNARDEANPQGSAATGAPVARPRN